MPDSQQQQKPMVSVIILVLGRIDDLLKCLDSIFRQAPKAIELEVVVVSNGGEPKLLEQIPSRPNLRVVEVPANLGFSGGCNLGARFAQGDNLIFLNDDTVVDPGWIEALVERANDADVGAVGSRLIDFDGRLQEAGGVLWRDGRTDRVGKGCAADDPRYITSRDVDYASACGLLITRHAWEMVGGFDEDFFPAYYEDVDLCMRLRAAGLRVVYEPKSQIHHRGSGSTAPELRLYAAEENAKRFVVKWKEELGKRPAFPGETGLAQRIDDLIKTPPAPYNPSTPSVHQMAGEPDADEVEDLALQALRREVAFQESFINSELNKLHIQLAKLHRMQNLLHRIPILRAVWRRTTERL